MANGRDGANPSSVKYGFEIDPCEVLGVGAGAKLEEIRDAYRQKARKHHPDHGGDDWAFRMVVRAYEALSTARVAGRAAQEARAASPPGRPAPFRTAAEGGSEWLRPGRRDPWIEPPRLVDVEILALRFDPDDPTDLLLIPAEERNLSCSLHLNWAAPPRGRRGEPHPDSDLARTLLVEAFAAVAGRTGPTSSWSHVDDDRFEGWLSYPTATRAWESFRDLHQALNDRGLGVNQWTRELIIPRRGR